MKKHIFFFLMLLVGIASCTQKEQQSSSGDPLHVEIVTDAEGYQLMVNGSPYFIKGARTLRTRYMDKVAEYGGNSVRIGYHDHVKEVLDEAHRLNLSVLFGLPVQAERNGFDYSDTQSVGDQFNRMKDIVSTFKDHPALLMWAIGNELDHIPGKDDYDLQMWNAVNDIAVMIHETDGNHPAMIVVGRGNNTKMKDIVERCGDVDLLGVNTYADIAEIPGWLREYGWNRPYVVTEWGPSGHWQVPRTRWGAVIEETSTEKALVYQRRYEEVIQADPWCLGSYVFLWTSNRQERTHTWYNMFHDDGSEKGPVEVMQYVWTGQWPDNRAPWIDSLQIDGLNALSNIELEAGTMHYAQVFVYDPEGATLNIDWELVPENKKFGAYAGQGETKPPVVEGAVVEKLEDGKKVQFKVPDEKGGNFRLFIYAFDDSNNAAVANIPFHVRQE